MGIRWSRWLAPPLASFLFVSNAAAQAPPAPPPGVLPPGSEWVRVTLPRVGRAARLEAYEGIKDKDPDEDAAWRNLCHEPCSLWIPSGTKLRVKGDFKDSDSFTLPRSATGFTLAVKPSVLDARPLGIVLTSIGGPLLFFGGLFYFNDSTSSSGKTTAGRVALFGLAGVGLGVVLIVSSSATSVLLQPSGAAARSERHGLALPSVSLGRGLSLAPDGLHF